MDVIAEVESAALPDLADNKHLILHLVENIFCACASITPPLFPGITKANNSPYDEPKAAAQTMLIGVDKPQ